MSARTEARQTPAQILIVEDSLTQAMKLQHLLEGRGFHVAVKTNGREALTALDELKPGLVITDINMPEMDGYELCRRIKDDERLKALPVILLTSLSDPRDILKGLECGADNFVVKPYNEDFLVSRIESVLANAELRRVQNGGANEIFFAGHKYTLTADRVGSIDLLLSTYETAVQKNLELHEAKEKLEVQADELRARNSQMEEELAMARELQSAFLPRHFPVFPSDASPEGSALQFFHRYMTTTDLGGDFFDIVPISETACGVLVCDVMGHGVRAALVTGIVRGLVEELKPVAADPSAFLSELNQSLCAVLKQTATPLFTTAFYLVADPGRGELRYANAGHPPPYHLRRSIGALEPLATPGVKAGPALGVFEAARYQTGQCPLSAGDMVMLYTDGLFEVENADGEFFTKTQLRDAVTRRLDQPAPRLFDELITEIKTASASGDFDDDMCLVGVEVPHLLAARI